MLPDSVLDNTYLRSFQSKQKITLRQFFENYKNTAVYLDFWYSGCRFCREANKASAKNKPYFAEKNIAVVYFSVDLDESAWLQAAKDDGVTENQYLLHYDSANGHPFSSLPLTRYLKIFAYGVPRYILFNKKHEIEVLNMPKPTQEMFEDLKKIVEHYSEKISSIK